MLKEYKQTLFFSFLFLLTAILKQAVTLTVGREKEKKEENLLIFVRDPISDAVTLTVLHGDRDAYSNVNN